MSSPKGFLLQLRSHILKVKSKINNLNVMVCIELIKFCKVLIYELDLFYTIQLFIFVPNDLIGGDS